MKIFNTISDLKNEIYKIKKLGKTIGFVPTMGYLHKGHVSLIQSSTKDNDVTVVSIFVNPTQFSAGEDLEKYPRDIEHDRKVCLESGADIMFIPPVEEMYPAGYQTYVVPYGQMVEKLCGKSRPGHFRGVATVVTKLFNIVSPDKAYFGQKDAQQAAVIEALIRDLNFDIEIIRCPIVREKDGLALSSRNTYLNECERQDATILYKSLKLAADKIKNGEIKDAKALKEFVAKNIMTVKYAVIDYVEVVDAKTLEEISDLKGDILVAVAVKIGKTRLIDNIQLEV